MVDITNLGNSERIKNIHTFLQGNNPLKLSEDITKSVLDLEDVSRELVLGEQTKRIQIEGSPRLGKPVMAKARLSIQSSPQGQTLNATALLVETFATIRRLLHEGNIGELNNRLQLLNLESTALRKQGQELLDSFANSTEEAANIENQRGEAKDQLDLGKTKLANALDSLKEHQSPVERNIKEITNTQEKLSECEQRLEQINTFDKPITEEIYNEEVNIKKQVEVLSNKLDELKNKRDGLEGTTGLLKAKVKTLTENVDKLQNNYNALINKEYDLIKISGDASKKLDAFIKTAPRPVEVDGDKWENTLSLLTMLTAQLKKVMNEDSIRNMKEQEAVMMEINEASRKNSDKKAKEAAESERKAAEANKAASCASKVFSYVLLAVSVIATVASFGTAAPLTLAIAAIGISMAVADIVLEETGHGSLMQMLANEISSAVTDVLISFGVDEDKAKQIGSIVGMIVAAIAFLAFSLLSMGSMVKNIANTVKSAAQLLLKNAGSILKNTVKSMPKSLMNALGNVATKTTKASDSVADGTKAIKQVGETAKNTKNPSVAMAKLEVSARGMNAGLTVASAATTGGLNVYAASMGEKMKEMLAGMMLNNAAIEAITELLNQLIQAMSKNYEQFDEMFVSMLNGLQKSSQSKVDMMNTARFA
ncbi:MULTISPECIES: type III secretion system translocon subunit SctE [Providencia]|uniref:Effector protein sipB n=1 Tax=Providencia rettgeri TaxID=587 RepID=A0A379FKR5_PRORE|nr:MULTISPECIES: type III secretion system translocon subunit SctE [Providencia]QXB06254.1 type III secretion system translocon subunit SctE [Providencia rettgeri]SUC29266.1 Effector protein sipB [Providencia rettgeri]